MKTHLQARRSVSPVRRHAVVAVAVVGMIVGACTSARSGSAASTSTSAATVAAHRPGTADVAFAGSLLAVDDKVVGPGFAHATGYAYTGRGGGSLGLAHEIASGEIAPGVFESVGSAPVAIVGSRRSPWYVQFAASPLVIAYNPNGTYGTTFERVAAGRLPLADAFDAMAAPGFRLGRTNPATDPQGQAFVMMVELAQRTLGLPAGIVEQILGPGVTTGGTGTTGQIFSETSLDAHLQAGQLDAASAFRSQAVQLHLHYLTLPAAVDLGDPADASGYAKASLVVPATATQAATTVHGAPLVIDIATVREPAQAADDAAAATAFVAYQLSAAGRQAYAAAGFTLLPATVVGTRSSVPASVLAAVRASG